MGTRSKTIVIDSDGEKHLQFYRQMDGYPQAPGHGNDLLEFMKSGRVVNGIPMNVKKERLFNGAGCFAAWLIASLKDGAGSIYLEPHDWPLYKEDYTYQIVVPEAGGQFHITVWEFDEQIFADNLDVFETWIKSMAEE